MHIMNALPEGLREIALSSVEKFCSFGLVDFHLPQDFKEFNQDVNVG